MRKFLFTMVLALMAISASAVPAKRGQIRTLTLEDGSTVQATLVGDEHGHYWLAGDGRAFLEKDDTGIFVLTDVNVLKANAKAKRSQVNKLRSQDFERRKVSFNGSKRGLIILVNFSNVSMQRGHDNALFQKIANQEDYKDSPFKGSMHDYFSDQSFGEFDLTFDVVGPITVSNTQAYYGQNNVWGDDQRPEEMVYEAIQQADDSVDFADYDWDNDGVVDQVYVIYAGKGEADGGASNTIWPHQYTLAYKYSASQRRFDGKYVAIYACGPELNGSGNICGIGTMCHEFSHCLGYPDFYDTDYSGGQGMGNWDLMDGGSYNGDGYQPAGYTSYERWVAGWHEPTELLYSQEVRNMQPLQESAESYIIYNKGNSNEYFLLENRQKVGWDASLPGEGLLILHVDYDDNAWAKPNDDPNHQRMTWIPADNQYQYEIYMGSKYYTSEGMATDPFPYGNVNAFGPETTPAATLYNTNSNGTKKLDSSVEDITQNSDGTVSFNFKGISEPVDFSGLYQLIKSNNDLESGKKYLIVSALPDDKYVAYNGFSTNKGLPGDVYPSTDNVITLDNETNFAVPVTLESSDGSWTILDPNDQKYLGGASGNSNYLTESSTAGTNYFKWSITISSNGIASIKNGGKNSYLKYNNASNGQCFRVYASGQQAVYLYKEFVETIDVPITAVGYGTLYYGEKNLIVPEGVEAITYKVVSDELVETKTYTTDDVIPAATGVVLKAAEGTYTFTVTTNDGEAAEENMLLGFDEAGTTTAGEGNNDSDYLFYCLNTKNGENVGFYWGATGGAPFTSKAHKAYLAVPKTEISQANNFVFSNDTDGIVRTHATATGNMVIYDLQGRRYAPGTNLSKGIYIIDGKKMVVR